MNFIYISPQFPRTCYNFCDRLKKAGVNVLGIGDTPYDNLAHEVKNSLHEYYYVENMEHYDEVLRAIAFFTFKHGKIDWLESNNEYWMNQDAQLRLDFHITTGYCGEEAHNIQRKSQMKEFYKKANIKTARWILVSDKKAASTFIKEVQFPVVVKPDIGVGASATYKICNDAELDDFFQEKRDVSYIMEEYVPGYICTFDGVANSKKEILFYTSHEFPTSIMDVVNQSDSLVYYSRRYLPEDLLEIGKRAVEVFPTKQRFFHFEFFRLLEDKQGLGKKGEIIGLEVNMRPPGGYTPDMMNFANNLDVYQIWADMIVKDTTNIRVDERPYICVFASRRDHKKYRHTHQEIQTIYKNFIVMEERMPEILSSAMGNQMYTACFKTMDEVETFVNFIQEEARGSKRKER